MLIPYLERAPAVAGQADLAADAALIGCLRADAYLTARRLATLRADGNAITVGRNAFFGERATVHIAHATLATSIADDVTLGSYALAHACTLHDGVVLGEAAVVMDGAIVGPGAVIAAGTLVSPRKELAGGFLYAGNPVKAVRPLALEETRALARGLREGTPAELVRAPGGESLAPPASLRPATVRAGRAFVAPTATLAGFVELADDSAVYFGCLLDAGEARIRLGQASNIQDNSLLVTDARYGDIVLGARVTVGHNVRMGAAVVEDEALIGMGAELAHGVVVERGACVAACAQVRSGTVVKAGWIWAGRPARAFRELKPAESEGFARGVDIYVEYGGVYRALLACPTAEPAALGGPHMTASRSALPCP